MPSPVRIARGTATTGSFVGSSLTISSVPASNGSTLVVALALKPNGFDPPPVVFTMKWGTFNFTIRAVDEDAGGRSLRMYTLSNVTGGTADITTTFSSGFGSIFVVEIMSVVTNSFDISAINYGTGSTPSVTSAAITTVPEIAIAALYVQTESNPGVLGSWGSGFTAGQSTYHEIEPFAEALEEGYKTLETISTVTADKSGLLSLPWVIALVTLKGTPVAVTGTTTYQYGFSTSPGRDSLGFRHEDILEKQIWRKRSRRGPLPQ